MKHFHGQHHQDERGFGERGGFGRGRHEHEGRGQHRGGGPGRFFESGDLRFLVLHLISETPRHGYEIIKLIENQMAGAHAPSPGIIYPTLTMLEEMGLAKVTVEGTRKLYAITDEGRRELETKRELIGTIQQRMQQAGERHARDRSGPIMRAMENLKMVLRMRGEQLPPEQLAAVTDIIDNAAKQIERLGWETSGRGE